MNINAQRDASRELWNFGLECAKDFVILDISNFPWRLNSCLGLQELAGPLSPNSSSLENSAAQEKTAVSQDAERNQSTGIEMDKDAANLSEFSGKPLPRDIQIRS
ncbi:hypothetical protein DSL72_006580 [Monilinia vaccinii-corymbosi]|uniref:Uncharacterized protein n=1 Tax=Monilinia vaccinii-corymbosi TaxID=61207 RepID=A0A8A3PP55_9HELO|nr:hypothetical protein DSL72_006580 [Monilinia vaccinii-corymbosi]